MTVGIGLFFFWDMLFGAKEIILSSFNMSAKNDFTIRFGVSLLNFALNRI